MSGVCALVVLVKLGSVPLVALPVDAVLGQILVLSFPSNGVIV